MLLRNFRTVVATMVGGTGDATLVEDSCEVVFAALAHDVPGMSEDAGRAYTYLVSRSLAQPFVFIFFFSPVFIHPFFLHSFIPSFFFGCTQDERAVDRARQKLITDRIPSATPSLISRAKEHAADIVALCPQVQKERKKEKRKKKKERKKERKKRT